MIRDVTLVIPTFNGKWRLSRCLEALYNQTYKDFKVIVVINGGHDGIEEMLGRYKYLELEVIVNSRNLGFAGAVNQGIRNSQSPYIGVLNDDTFPEPEWLEALVTRIEEAPDIGACASLMVFDCCPDIVQSAGISIDRAAIAWERWRGRPIVEAQAGGEVFGASAGAALYRRRVFEEIGLFDERFFAYLEDVDLAWRAQAVGWRCLYVPSAKVRHITSATLGHNSPLKSMLLGRNKVWLMIKNLVIYDIKFAIFYDLIYILYNIICHFDRYSLLGRIEGWRYAPAFLNDRHPSRPRILDPLVLPWHVYRRFPVHNCFKIKAGQL